LQLKNDGAKINYPQALFNNFATAFATRLPMTSMEAALKW